MGLNPERGVPFHLSHGFHSLVYGLWAYSRSFPGDQRDETVRSRVVRLFESVQARGEQPGLALIVRETQLGLGVSQPGHLEIVRSALANISQPTYLSEALQELKDTFLELFFGLDGQMRLWSDIESIVQEDVVDILKSDHRSFVFFNKQLKKKILSSVRSANTGISTPTLKEFSEKIDQLQSIWSTKKEAARLELADQILNNLIYIFEFEGQAALLSQYQSQLVEMSQSFVGVPNSETQSQNQKLGNSRAWKSFTKQFRAILTQLEYSKNDNKAILTNLTLRVEVLLATHKYYWGP